LANATGECGRYFDEYHCDCNEDYVWDGDADACVAFECSAIDLGTFDGTRIGQTGDTCDGTSLYNAFGNGVSSCTRYTSEAKELVYKLTVPARVAVEVHMELTTDFDASLWVTTSCDDVLGLKCVVGADDPETVVIHNDTTEDQTYYIIADAYEDCGAFTLTISSLGECGNGVKEGREQAMAQTLAGPLALTLVLLRVRSPVVPNANWTLQIATTARFSQWVAPAQPAQIALLACVGTNSTRVCLVATALINVRRNVTVGIQPISV